MASQLDQGTFVAVLFPCKRSGGAFTELEACSAFFCDAVAYISIRDDALDESFAEGHRFSYQWPKEKSASFKQELNAAWLAASSLERH